MLEDPTCDFHSSPSSESQEILGSVLVIFRWDIHPPCTRICPCDESGRSVTVTPVRPVIKVISDMDVSFLKQGLLKIAENLGQNCLIWKSGKTTRDFFTSAHVVVLKAKEYNTSILQLPSKVLKFGMAAMKMEPCIQRVCQAILFGINRVSHGNVCSQSFEVLRLAPLALRAVFLKCWPKITPWRKTVRMKPSFAREVAVSKTMQVQFPLCGLSRDIVMLKPRHSSKVRETWETTDHRLAHGGAWLGGYQTFEQVWDFPLRNGWCLTRMTKNELKISGCLKFWPSLDGLPSGKLWKITILYGPKLLISSHAPNPSCLSFPHLVLGSELVHTLAAIWQKRGAIANASRFIQESSTNRVMHFMSISTSIIYIYM